MSGISEFLLVLSNLLFGGVIIAYFYFREVKNKINDTETITKLDSFYQTAIDKMQTIYTQQFSTLKDLAKSKDDLTQEALLEYLKHTERLEKMVLPKPVTRRAVEEILAQTPSLVPNDIEKTDQELDQDQLNDLLSRIPITKDTKVKIEGDLSENGLAEEVFSGSISE
jgi:hypothetical protein